MVNTELGHAVTEALRWLEATPETAGAALGMNGRTLAAMCQGVVPMRSLVIRFATELARHCQSRGGAPAWWADVDAWLKLAGYAPRREPLGEAAPSPSSSGQSSGPETAPPMPRAGDAAPPVAPAPELPARDCFRPVYECRSVNGTAVHVFGILDAEQRRIFEICLPGHADYKARAGQVKQDLANLTQSAFERKYARFRVSGRWNR